MRLISCVLVLAALAGLACGEDGQGGIFGGGPSEHMCFNDHYCLDNEFCSKDGVCLARQQTPVMGIGCDGQPGPVMRLRTRDLTVSIEWQGPNRESLRIEETPSFGVVTAPDHACRVLVRPCGRMVSGAWATLPGVDGLEHELYQLDPDGSWGAQNDGLGRAAADAHCAP